MEQHLWDPVLILKVQPFVNLVKWQLVEERCVTLQMVTFVIVILLLIKLKPFLLVGEGNVSAVLLVLMLSVALAFHILVIITNQTIK